MNDILISSPLLVLFLFSLLPLSIKLFRRNQEASPYLSGGIICGGILVSIFCLFHYWPEVKDPISLFSGSLVFNHFRAIVSLFLLTVGLFVVGMNIKHPQVDKNRFSEILFLEVGALNGLFILLWAGNLLIAFIGLELASLAFYLLIALGRTGSEALKASFKYFVLGSVASAIMLYGISFLMGATGHFDLQAVFQKTPELVNQSRLLAIALVFILGGFLFKVSIFPFQFWLPDVYRGSSTPLLVLMVTGFKLVVFALLFEWTKDMFTQVNLSLLVALFQWLAVLSMLFGNIIALLQKDFKRMLLFSTVAHSAYLFMILQASQMGFAMGKIALLYYLMTYLVLTGGIFICLRPFEKQDDSTLSLSHLEGLAYKKPFHATLITLFLLGLAGIPPTGGFVAKLFVFQALLSQGLWWVLFWTILGSSVALYYYLKPIALMFMKKASTEEFNSFPRFLVPALLALATLVLVTGFLPSLFLNYF